MSKIKVLIANSAGKVAIIDTNPPGRAVIGQNVYYQFADGTQVLLSPEDILNNTPIPVRAASSQIKSTASTAAKGVTGFGGGGGTGGGGGSGLINTDGLPEGVVNKYFTRSRAMNALTTYFA